MKKVLVLGATGSIGSSTLDIARNMKDDFKICGLQCHSNKEKLEELAGEFNSCPTLLTSEESSKDAFVDFLNKTQPDIVVNGIAGAAGLLPSKLIIENNIDLALANKETIVMAGPLIKALAKKHNINLIPVDSEHSAIFNLINQAKAINISKVIITASGGPFRNYSKEELKNVSVEAALNHPTWKMGPKITIDSSTLANKGLEVIEAGYLFNLKREEIDVVVHPQSLVHSLVQTKDGMLYAQISDPDMKHPIYGALTYPKIKENYLKPFSLFDVKMEFYKPSYELFPMLGMAFECLEKGLPYTIAFNAANEIAVHAFLNHKIQYLDIPQIVNKSLSQDLPSGISDFDSVFEIDAKVREFTRKFI